MKKIAIFLLILMLMLINVACTHSKETDDTEKVDIVEETIPMVAKKIVEFGSYPQHRIRSKNTIAALNSLDVEWKSFDYYILSQKTDKLKYCDVEYNGKKYRGITFDSFRPLYSYKNSQSNDSNQGLNKYYPHRTYWFKYEPLEWIVLNDESGLMATTMIVDSQSYCDMVYTDETTKESYTDPAKEFFANNYKESTIRHFLNNDFYNTAFSDEEKEMIAQTELDNSALAGDYSKYDSESTTDKVFLLSYDEATDSKNFADEHSRIKEGTDYAKANGLFVCKNDSESDGMSRYWLRSPSSSSMSACIVYINGNVNSGERVDYTSGGVVPAIILK